MDTRFWGPSGWCLLHLIAANPHQPNKKAVKAWFDLLEFILPCKYCRASFHDYTQLQPLTMDIVGNRDAFSRWLFDIHNRVNSKLRGQGLLTASDPSWSSVREKYYGLQRSLCKASPFIGWDFMTSIAYSTPGADYTTVPMSDAPEHKSDWSSLPLNRRNRYNLLTRKERLTVLRQWWKLIPSILPCAAWRSAWTRASAAAGEVPLAAGREAVMHWIWRIEESVCAGLKCPTPHPSLPALKEEVAAFESGCSKNRRGQTCRTRKHRQRHRVMRRRTIRV